MEYENCLEIKFYFNAQIEPILIPSELSSQLSFFKKKEKRESIVDHLAINLVSCYFFVNISGFDW